MAQRNLARALQVLTYDTYRGLDTSDPAVLQQLQKDYRIRIVELTYAFDSLP